MPLPVLTAEAVISHHMELSYGYYKFQRRKVLVLINMDRRRYIQEYHEGEVVDQVLPIVCAPVRKYEPWSGTPILGDREKVEINCIQ